MVDHNLWKLDGEEREEVFNSTVIPGVWWKFVYRQREDGQWYVYRLEWDDPRLKRSEPEQATGWG